MKKKYSDWTILRRETLKDIYLVLLSKLAGYEYQSMILRAASIILKRS